MLMLKTLHLSGHLYHDGVVNCVSEQVTEPKGGYWGCPSDARHPPFQGLYSPVEPLPCSGDGH